MSTKNKCQQKTLNPIKLNSTQLNLIQVSYHQESSYNLEDYQERLLGEKDFMKSEALGCEPPRRCGKCRDCEQCGFRGAHISQKESQELRMIEEKISYDENAGKWRTSYPYKQDPRVLSNNYMQVRKMQESTEHSLLKKNKS